ncbi:alkaline phosphatase family protein [Streptomyces laculatispora]|uniref:phospholipase C n=1 Tax=Streptomyces laculatispora TaxID=887464 RepID=A0ABY9I8R4_9ACTN|nr:alkaline phosphatase family protein [Streptomyces laculatispora]WLQ43266.1 alkaline phosphatase family protein [Streptomyces laculatispora]
MTLTTIEPPCIGTEHAERTESTENIESSAATGGAEVAENAVRPSGEHRITRRRMLRTAAVALGAMAAGPVAEAVGGARAGAAEYVLPKGFNGDMSDLKHVVILMQENRSFDHYLGQLPGVRGHHDKQVLRFQDGTDVFQQRDATGTIVRPAVSTATWSDNHNFYGANEGRWNTWVKDKGDHCMWYYSPGYMPWMYSLASQYTVCDMNFCSLHGPTIPNRYYLMTGSAGGETSNAGQNNYSRGWTTVPEQLQQAGIDWRVYSDNSGKGVGGSLQSGYVGEYGCNVTNSFTSFDPRTADEDDLEPGTGKVWKANSFVYAGATTPNDDSEANLDAVLRDLIAACEPGAEHPLPEVSWVVMPAAWSEHPGFDTVHGERYMNKVLRTLQSNEDIWNHTLVIITYDENDGKFDHVLPPRPEPGTAGEFSGTTPYGFGPRVPMLLVSPWTRGGYVASEVFDHTSTVKFLETWAASLGKPFTCPNITDWRRAVAGDLTSAIDFAHPQPGPVVIADPVTGTPPELPADRMKPRGLSFHPHATFTENRSAGTVTASMTLSGGPAGKAVSLQVFPDRYLAFANTPYTVTEATPRSYTWDVKKTDGKYAFSVYGPDGFLRSFAGQVIPASQKNIGIPRIGAELGRGRHGEVRLTLHNDGTQAVRYTLTANDYLGGTQRYTVAGGASTVVDWPTEQGYYDVVLTASTGTGWTQRYAGRVSTV